MSAVRLFLALNLAPELQQALAVATQPLVDAAPALAWVRPAQLHLTLKFLGQVDRAAVPDLSAVARDAARGQARHEVVLGGVGAFPNLRRARVVWLGMHGADALVRMAAALDRGAAALGVPPDGRPFRPHVTIARVKVPPPVHQQAALERAAGSITVRLVVPVREIALMRSAPEAGGSRYDALETFPLGEP